MKTFVLIAGAWHAAWCWERVIPVLEAAGHRVIAPDLIGTGDDPVPDRAVANLGTWVEQIAGLIADLDGTVILVGHSRAGIVISAVAERIPQKIAALVYLSAFLVASGATILDTLGHFSAEQPTAPFIMRDDGTSLIDPDAVAATFYNRTDPAWIARAQSRLGPEPMSVFATPLRLTPEAFGSVKRIYLECTQDNAIPLALQRFMQNQLPCDQVMTMTADHSPFYSCPDTLSAILTEILAAT